MLRVFTILAAVMIVAQSGWAQDAGRLRQLGQLKEAREAPLKIQGAKVSTEDQAEKIGLEAYFKRMGGLRALQTAKVVSINKLDFDMKGFAQKGDKVWEIRIVGLSRELSAVIWVHSQTAKTFFLVPTER